MEARNSDPAQQPRRQPPTWLTKMPLILTLTAGACSADIAYDQLAPRPHCQATGPHRKYVVSELRLPSPQDGLAGGLGGQFAHAGLARGDRPFRGLAPGGRGHA